MRQRLREARVEAKVVETTDSNQAFGGGVEVLGAPFPRVLLECGEESSAILESAVGHGCDADLSFGGAAAEVEELEGGGGEVHAAVEETVFIALALCYMIEPGERMGDIPRRSMRTPRCQTSQ